MAVRTFRLGSPRTRGEGLRLGTVRFLPRGVRSEDYARLDLFDVWLPTLAPSPETMKAFRAGERTPRDWKRFVAAYTVEMAKTDARQVILVLAALSRTARFGVGCFCEEEARCHRSILIGLLAAAGADVEGGG